MRKSSFLGSVVALLCVVSVSWGTIQSVNVNDVDSEFTAGGGNFGLGTLELADAVDIVVEDTDGTQTTHMDGSFSMTTYLELDDSEDFIASGKFAEGALSFLDSGANTLLAGNILELNLIEIFDDTGILGGNGQFAVTGGSLSGDFVLPLGNIVQITFQVVPATLEDFSQNFTGFSNLTLTPIPEPATMGLLAIGGLLLYRRKR